MNSHKHFVQLLAAIVFTSTIPRAAEARAVPVARNVVLVHGLYADGSSWIDVIPYLQRVGLNVTAVQNPLTSLADDVAATRRVLASQDGPTVLVGTPLRARLSARLATTPRFLRWYMLPRARRMRARTSVHWPRHSPNRRRARE